MDRRLRIGLWVVAGSAALPGVWALLAPTSFFEEFPGSGFSWVELFPPYNEHLIRDVGAFYLAFAVMLGSAALLLARPLVRAVLVGWLVFSTPHLFFHLFNLDGFDAADAIGQITSLALVVALPIWLLLSLRSEGDPTPD